MERLLMYGRLAVSSLSFCRRGSRCLRAKTNVSSFRLFVSSLATLRKRPGLTFSQRRENNQEKNSKSALSIGKTPSSNTSNSFRIRKAV